MPHKDPVRRKAYAREYARAWYHRNKEKCEVWRVAYYARVKDTVPFKEKRAAYMRMWAHGVTPEQYDAMLAECGGECCICRTAAPLVVDHDHKSGRVRGLLCNLCNKGIGLLKENAEHFMNAVNYLRDAQRRAQN